MIVLSVYYTDKPGGFCKRLYRLLRALHAVSHEVHYCALDLPPDHVCDTVHFHRIPFWTTRRSGLLFWGTFLLWAPFFLAFTATRVKPSRYVVFGAFYSSILAPARLFHPAPLVLFLRSLVFEIDRITGKPALVRAISGSVERFGIRSATKVVTMTRAMTDAVQKFIGGRLKSHAVLPNDLPISTGERRDLRELIAAKPKRIALTAGVLDERKNIATLIEAWRSATGPEKGHWGLIVAGKGPLEESLKAKAFGESSIHFTGWVKELESYVGSADLILHPSLHEGISNAVLEGLAAGVPVLTSDIPEHRELFRDPGLRCEPGEWHARLARVFTDPSALADLRKGSVAAGAELRFDWDNSAAALVAQQ